VPTKWRSYRDRRFRDVISPYVYESSCWTSKEVHETRDNHRNVLAESLYRFDRQAGARNDGDAFVDLLRRRGRREGKWEISRMARTMPVLPFTTGSGHVLHSILSFSDCLDSRQTTTAYGRWKSDPLASPIRQAYMQLYFIIVNGSLTQHKWINLANRKLNKHNK